MQLETMEKITHIFDCMEPTDFNFTEVGTRFEFDTLVVYYGEYKLSIERFFYIRNQSGIVTLNDFKQGIL